MSPKQSVPYTRLPRHDVVESSFVEPEYGYYIETGTFNTARLMEPSPGFNTFEFDKLMAERIGSVFGRAPYYGWDDTPAWHRRPRETLAHWEQRLQRGDWLDNPATRWEYQKAVWSAGWQAFRVLLARLLVRRGESE